LSADLNDILKTAAQTQSVLSPVENSESDVEDGQEKLTRDLRLSSTRAASMYVKMRIDYFYSRNGNYLAYSCDTKHPVLGGREWPVQPFSGSVWLE